MIVALSSVLATAATAEDVTPVEKVIIMMEDMQSAVVTEGKAEAKTYDKFACFCKDMTNEKTDAIKAGQDEVETLTADIEELQAKREKLDEEIAEFLKKIAEVEKKMAEAQAERAKTLAVYEANAADMTGALTALKAAIKALKGSRPASLVELRSVVKTVRRATLIADALGVGSPKTMRAVTALLQQPEVPMQDYSFHSEDIIKMLEELLSDFKETKKDIDAAEVKSIAEHDKLMQALTSEKKDLEGDPGKAKAAKGATITAIEEKSGDLTTTSATLLDDQEYLKELAAMCEEKAKTWDQRSKMRADELSALTEAIAIVKGVVAAKTTEKTVRLVQRHASLGAAMIVAHSEEDMEAIEAASEADEDAAANAGVAFLQLRQPRTLLSQLASKAVAKSSDAPEQDKRAQVLALLRSESQTLKSTLLADLASRVAADPFAKIKKLIQELIERLLQEAADESNH